MSAPPARRKLNIQRPSAPQQQPPQIQSPQQQQQNPLLQPQLSRSQRKRLNKKQQKQQQQQQAFSQSQPQPPTVPVLDMLDDFLLEKIVAHLIASLGTNEERLMHALRLTWTCRRLRRIVRESPKFRLGIDASEAFADFCMMQNGEFTAEQLEGALSAVQVAEVLSFPERMIVEDCTPLWLIALVLLRAPRLRMLGTVIPENVKKMPRDHAQRFLRPSELAFANNEQKLFFHALSTVHELEDLQLYILPESRLSSPETACLPACLKRVGFTEDIGSDPFFDYDEDDGFGKICLDPWLRLIPASAPLSRLEALHFKGQCSKQVLHQVFSACPGILELGFFPDDSEALADIMQLRSLQKLSIGTKVDYGMVSAALPSFPNLKFIEFTSSSAHLSENDLRALLLLPTLETLVISIAAFVEGLSKTPLSVPKTPPLPPLKRLFVGSTEMRSDLAGLFASPRLLGLQELVLADLEISKRAASEFCNTAGSTVKFLTLLDVSGFVGQLLNGCKVLQRLQIFDYVALIEASKANSLSAVELELKLELNDEALFPMLAKLGKNIRLLTLGTEIRTKRGFPRRFFALFPRLQMVRASQPKLRGSLSPGVQFELYYASPELPICSPGSRIF